MGRFLTNMYDGESISSVARRYGVAPNLLYRWRKLMLEGRSIAVAADDSVTGSKTVRDMEARIRELERQLGRKTMEVEILKEALDKSRAKARLCPVADESANGSSVIGDGLRTMSERPCLRSR